ncbi:MAG: hypothetical protein K2K63_12730 [Acetatifactor sp.]|nr:hypothetical protein [Acetatifactor sp.]
MEKEMDLSIARFIKEYWEREEAEERERVRKQYDPKERITYTLEELIEGIRSGHQMLYTLPLEFETRCLLDGKIMIPYIKNFFEVEDDEPEAVLLAGNKRKVAFSLSSTPCKKMAQSMDDWIAQTRERFKEMHWVMKPERKKSLGNMEYFCFAMPTSEGRLYNVMFRFHKDERLYAGVLNCPEEERKGMGLLLEAMVYVIQEMNG